MRIAWCPCRCTAGGSAAPGQPGRAAGAPHRQSGRSPFVPQALIRRRATRTQVGLSRAARAENLTGAFLVPPERSQLIAGRRVLLVDDVRNHRATANAAARALIRGGAAAVDLLTFALVGEPVG